MPSLGQLVLTLCMGVAFASYEADILAAPSATRAAATLKHLTAKAHMAGTAEDRETALYVQQQLLSALSAIPSAQVAINEVNVLLSYPVERSVTLTLANGTTERLALAEAIVDSDPTSDTVWRNRTFNGYGPSGVADATYVYANYGLPADFDALAAAGVSVAGRVVLVRYGKCFRGLKVMNAESRGAIGVIIYSDPADDGAARGPVYPNGPWRPATSVQRGSVQYLSLCPGSPSGGRAESVCGFAEADTMPKIPVLPISAHDATPLLNALADTTVMPPAAGFQGAVASASYNAGPSTATVRVYTNNTFAVSPIWNIIATIPGSLPYAADRRVLVGNHRDAWVFGATDPNSGTTVLLETAHALSAAYVQGWRPARTLQLCNWDGEEYGLLGSTAYGENNAEVLNKTALVYLNVDIGVTGLDLSVAASGSLSALIRNVSHYVPSPRDPSKMVSEEWSGTVDTLGSGSDYTVFLDYLGIPSLDFGFLGDYGVYHSTFDSYTWVETQGDPTFAAHVAAAQTMALMAMRCASDAVVPLDMLTAADKLDEHRNSIATLATQHGISLDYTELDSALASFRTSASSLMSLANDARLTASPDTAPSTSALVTLNDRLAFTERRFLNPAGLPNRKYWKSVIQAPGRYSGYSPAVFPGIWDAIVEENAQEAQQQVGVTASYVGAAVSHMTPDSPWNTRNAASASALAGMCIGLIIVLLAITWFAYSHKQRSLKRAMVVAQYYENVPHGLASQEEEEEEEEADAPEEQSQP